MEERGDSAVVFFILDPEAIKIKFISPSFFPLLSALRISRVFSTQ